MKHNEDIVRKLMNYYCCHDGDIDEAANEIERLRSERKDVLYQLEFLQAELAALAMDMNDLRDERDQLRDEVERLKAELSKQIAASNNILDSEVDCDYRYEQGCLAALKRVQRFLDSEEE